MYDIDRSVIILVPQESFWIWLKSLPGIQLEDVSLAQLQNAPNSYLVAPCEDLDDAWEIIEEIAADIFSIELSNWSDDKAFWPELSFDIFSNWFTVLLSSIVTDAVTTEIEREQLPFQLT